MIEDCKVISLPKIKDERGNLSFIEQFHHVPFEISRIYYLYDVPGGAERGGHAHKELHQLIIPVAGSFQVRLDDGNRSETYFLNSPSKGLYVCPMIWRDILEFSSGSVCLVLASDIYKESDYYRDYNDFLKGL
jgi:dTDP-4-dehydrorhamnose 3,5-epimerase-like enzyme